MNNEMSQESADRQSAFFFSDYRRTDAASPYGEITSSCGGLPDGSACHQVIPIRHGLYITVGRFGANWGGAMNFEIAGAPIDFEYWLSGSGQCRVIGMGASPSVFRSGPGAMNASYAPDTSGQCMAVGEDEICVVGLSVDPMLLYSLVGEEACCFPDQLRPNAEGMIREKFTLSGTLPPSMHAACHQILNCPFSGGCRSLFLESKALELLALQVSALSSSPCDVVRGMTHRDTDRIHEARDCLVADLKNPPTIARLARQTGINETKLKAGFRTVYGTTLFDYLRTHKMEMARAYLEAGEKNVSEAAHDVGYANVSHFIRAYRTVFGVNPGDVLRRGRRGTSLT